MCMFGRETEGIPWSQVETELYPRIVSLSGVSKVSSPTAFPPVRPYNRLVWAQTFDLHSGVATGVDVTLEYFNRRDFPKKAPFRHVAAVRSLGDALRTPVLWHSAAPP